MSRGQVFFLTTMAMLAFAGNSLLCRIALKQTSIDPATFTSVRLISGAITLWLITLMRSQYGQPAGSWLSALALFGYAAGFSFAYVTLSAATGALLLFGAVQVTMIGYGFSKGERMNLRQSAGLLFACGGLAWLLLPGVSAPPATGSILMIGAGIAWGVYSLRGKGAGDPTAVTAGNFLRAAPMAAALSLLMISDKSLDLAGIIYALASGAIASGIGYSIWYTSLRGLKASSAATVQLSVPAIAAAGGIIFLGEALTPRLVVASIAILGGIALVIMGKQAATR